MVVAESMTAARPAIGWCRSAGRRVCKADRPITHLAGFKGILQVDGYAGYGKLVERGDVQRSARILLVQ